MHGWMKAACNLVIIINSMNLGFTFRFTFTYTSNPVPIFNTSLITSSAETGEVEVRVTCPPLVQDAVFMPH